MRFEATERWLTFKRSLIKSFNAQHGFFWLLLACTTLALQPAEAQHRMLIETGYSVNGNLVRVGLQKDWPWRWFEQRAWMLTGYWEFETGFWISDSGNNDLFDIGFTPVFRIQKSQPLSAGWLPFIEAGIGVHLLSGTTFDDKEISTNFQFGDHIGVGLIFGSSQQFSLLYRFQHHSNANIKKPNPGVDFHVLQFAFAF